MSRTAHSKARFKFLAGGRECSALLLCMKELDFLFLGFQQCKTNARLHQYSIALNSKGVFPGSKGSVEKGSVERFAGTWDAPFHTAIRLRAWTFPCFVWMSHGCLLLL